MSLPLGIFSRTFTQPTLDGLLNAAQAHGLRYVHFNLACAGAAIDNIPEVIDDELCGTIRAAFSKRGLTMCSTSGTFNAIHPDRDERESLIRRACHLIERGHDLGTSIVTLCTGSRDSNSMWQKHPGNDLPDAWDDLTATLECLLIVAERHNIVLGIEPEKGNVINSAVKARRILDQMKSRHLKIVIDGANLFEPQDETHMQSVLEEAFDLLGTDIAMAHAKDITDDDSKTDQAAGTGRLDWATYCRLLKQYGYDGPVVLHNLNESQVDSSIAFLKRHLAE